MTDTDRNKIILVQTNDLEKAKKTVSQGIKNYILLTQTELPLSPISSFVVKNFDRGIFEKVSKNISSDVREYFLNLIEGREDDISRMFEEYFDRVEFCVKTNEFRILLSKLFLEIIKKNNVENIIIVVKVPEFFKCTVSILKTLLGFNKGIKIIVIQRIDKVLEYSSDECIKLNALLFENDSSYKYKTEYKLHLSNFYSYYKWMCWEICQKIGANLVSKTQKTFKLEFIMKFIFSLIGVGEIDNAIDYLAEFIEELKRENNLPLLAKANRLLGYLYAVSQSRWKLAHNTAKKSYEIALRLNDEKEMVLSKSLLFILGLLNQNETLELFDQIYRNQNNFPKLYRYISNFYYFYITASEALGPETILSVAKESIRTLGKRKDNFFLITHYHLLANIFLRLGMMDKAITSSQKALRIDTFVGKPNITHLYNNLSYVYYSMDNFSKALHFSKKSLMKSIEEKDLKEICMSLVNICYIYMIANNYHNASKIMNILMKVKHFANIKELPIHSNVKLWVMDMFIKSKIQEVSIFVNNLISFTKEEFENLDKEGKAFYYWGLSMVATNINDKVYYLQTAMDFIVQNGFKYVEAKILKDLISTLEKLGQADKAKEIKERFLELRNDHKMYKKVLETEEEILRLPPIKIEEELVIQQAYYQKQLISFQNRKNELKFLNTLQEIIIKETDEERLINKILNIIINSFLLEKVIFFDKEKNRIFSIPELTEEEKYFIENLDVKAERYITDSGMRFLNLYILPVYFSNRETKGFFVLASNTRDLFIDKDQTSLLRINALLISNKLEVIKNSSKIEQIAKIDFLTGIANRNEVNNILIKEVSRCRRIQNYCFSLALIDLDNFKYYNDRFGHIIGDILLKEFATLLSKQVRKTDFIGRFGGDEFVVIMPHTNKEKAILAAKRWLKMFDTMFYRDTIKAFKGEDIDIPADKKLGMSIGISDIIEAKYDIERLFTIADQRLYISKTSSEKVN
ncbi:MAG: GGDEF domain-containing protein [Brevinematia bacterium]